LNARSKRPTKKVKRMRRVNKVILLALALTAAFLLYVRLVVYGPTSGPNVILITAHTLRPDHLSSYGYERLETTAINSLAKKSVLFENAYCNIPMPVYGYASILTGKVSSLAVRNKDNRVVVDDSLKGLGERLKLKGYTTALVAADVSLLPISGPAPKDFDIIKNAAESLPGKDLAGRDRVATEKAIKALKELKRKRKPVFAWISYALPMYPYDMPADFKKAKNDFPYDRQILLLDEEISKLLEGLRKLHLSKNTVIIFTSASGESLGEHREPYHGTFLYNSTVRVPLVIKLPKTSVGKKITALSSHADITPIVLDILKIDYDKKDFDGENLLQQPKGKESLKRDIYLESLNSNYIFGWSPLVGIVSEDYKYIEAPVPELYDLSKDPHELKNITQQEVKKSAEMRERLIGFINDRRPQLLGILNKGEDPKSKADILTPYLVAVRYLKDREPDFLITFYEKLLEKDSKNKAIFFALARLCAANNRPYSAEGYLVSLTKYYPDFNPAWGLLGDVYGQQGKLYEAISCYEKVIAIAPDSPGALNNLAWLYAQKGEYLQRALRYAQRANELAKDNASFIDTLAEVHLKMGDIAKAKELLKKALSLDPKSEYLQKRVKEMEGKK